MGSGHQKRVIFVLFSTGQRYTCAGHQIWISGENYTALTNEQWSRQRGYVILRSSHLHVITGQTNPAIWVLFQISFLLYNRIVKEIRYSMTFYYCIKRMKNYEIVLSCLLVLPSSASE